MSDCPRDAPRAGRYPPRMSIYGPKAGQPRPVTQKPLHWVGVLIGVVIGLGLGIYFVLEEERESQQAAQRQRADAIRLDPGRAEPIRRDAARTAPTRESADILVTVPDPPKIDEIEPLQSADIIH